jgi:hypothetical protein
VFVDGIEEDIVVERTSMAQYPCCSVSVVVFERKRLVAGRQLWRLAIAEVERNVHVFGQGVEEVMADRFDLMVAVYMLVRLGVLLIHSQLSVGLEEVLNRCWVYLYETVAVVSVAIPPVEGAQVEVQAARAVVGLAVSISQVALWRIRRVGRRGNRISRTCPSTSPIAPDMGDTPSHHRSRAVPAVPAYLGPA